MIKNPKLSQLVWFIEDFTMRPRKVQISYIWSDYRVVVDEDRTFTTANLYRSKQKAIAAKTVELNKAIEVLGKQKLTLAGYLEE